MSERFYVNLPLTIGPILLDGSEAHHLASVCRLRAGAEVCLFNGDGHEYPARIATVGRREVTLEIIACDKPDRELPFRLEVAAPMPKGDRAQFLIEKLTELGVTQIVPLICERSNVHPRDCKREKLERWVIEACKQCGRNVLMKVHEPTMWENYTGRGNSADLRLLAHPAESRPRAPREDLHTRSLRSTVIAVGPEGGFTDAEVERALQAGWQTVNLGPRILRVETAAIALATLAIGLAGKPDLL